MNNQNPILILLSIIAINLTAISFKLYTQEGPQKFPTHAEFNNWNKKSKEERAAIRAKVPMVSVDGGVSVNGSVDVNQ